MPIVRHAPGERPPIAGTYALVGHYGDPMGFTVKIPVGGQLPLVLANGTLWFVLVDVASEAAEAA